MLIDELRRTLTASLKAGERRHVDTLRFLLAAVRNAAIAKYGAKGETGMTDADVLDVIKKQAKTHKESIEAFENAGRAELAMKEKEELAILEAYQPKELSDDEIKALLTPIVASGEKNFGLLMGAVMKTIKGQADGGRVSAILKQILEPK